MYTSLSIAIHNYLHLIIFFTAYLLSQQWRKSQLGTELPEKVFLLPKECKAFQEYYDHIQQALESIAGMDDLLAGSSL